MKRVLAALSLLTLGGCGTVHNFGAGPRVYGGVRYNSSQRVGCREWNYVFDAALLPVTVASEGLRCVIGWPPKGVLTT